MKGNDKVRGGWRKYVGLMMKFKINAFHQILVLVFRSEIVRWTGHVNNANRFWLENFKKTTSSFAAVLVPARTVQKFILQKRHCACGLHLLGLV